ncbi:MAG: V-type ATPase subunit, partial [Candidatus Diapherotrites archaeon]
MKRIGKEPKFKTKNEKSLLKKITSKLINGSGKSSGYAYTNTRVRVMKSKLLTSETYQKLLKMQPDEITRYLEETEYKKEIDQLAAKYEGINLIEYGLTQNLENTFNRIHNFSIGLSRDQIKLYLKKWDIWNVKTILRGKYANASKDEIINSIVAAGSSPLSFWENVIDKANNVRDVIEMMHGNPFYEELKQNSADLGKMEDILDRFYYQFVLEHAEPELKKYIVQEINTINTLNSLRTERLGDYNYWIDGGTELIQV